MQTRIVQGYAGTTRQWDNDGVWLGTNPLVVCDVADHAFAKGYPRREDYTTKVLDHIDWDKVSGRYKVERM